MKKNIILALLICIVFILHWSGCQRSEVELNWDESNPDILGQYLQGPLWDYRFADDAAWSLLIPLHHAFYTGDEKLKQDFEDFFTGYLDENEIDLDPDRYVVTFHFVYFTSHYPVLCKQTETESLVAEKLHKKLLDLVKQAWTSLEVKQWGNRTYRGFREWVNDALTATDNNGKSYWNAIQVHELLVMATAANLLYCDGYLKKNASDKDLDILRDIRQTALRVFRERSTFTPDGGWLFQVGSWKDHPDMLYAGNGKIVEGMEVAPVDDIVQDSSHMMRFAPYALSFIRAYDAESPGREFFLKMYRGMKNQFLSKVIVEPAEDFPAYRMNNYFSGLNGVYRYRYKTQGSSGYGPFELSGSLPLGWWALLGGPEVENVFSRFARCFPLAENVVSQYVGPNTTRERHPAETWPDFFTKGYAKLIVEDAAEVAKVVGKYNQLIDQGNK